MRLSIDKSDRGYKPDTELAKFRIMFNGQEQHDCHTVDEEMQFIRRLVKKQPAPWLAPKFVAGPIIHGVVQIIEKK